MQAREAPGQRTPPDRPWRGRHNPSDLRRPPRTPNHPLSPPISIEMAPCAGASESPQHPSRSGRGARCIAFRGSSRGRRGSYSDSEGVMFYRVLADAVVLAHLCFIAFVAVGGVLAWRWPRLVWLHL